MIYVIIYLYIYREYLKCRISFTIWRITKKYFQNVRITVSVDCQLALIYINLDLSKFCFIDEFFTFYTFTFAIFILKQFHDKSCAHK